jgi:hypothetical protein
MRGLRSFLLLVVVGLGLAGYLYFVESKRDPADADKKDKVFTVESDKIDELVVKSESGERTTLKKTGAEWRVVEPVSAPTDGAAVSGITGNLASLEVSRVIDENPSDVAEYGLTQPRLELEFKAGGQSHKLFIGRKTPAGNDLYARIDGATRVILVPSYVDTTFNKTTFDLRDKTVLKFDRDKIENLSIASPKQVLRFAKADGEWKLTAPIAARADFTTVDGLVSRLNTLQAKTIAAPESVKPTDTGFDKPEATIQLGSGSAQATLVLGKSSADGAVYARDQSQPTVFTVESTLLADVTKAPGEYRQKDFFDGRAFNSTKLEVTRGGQTSVFEKTRTKNKEGQDEEKWKQTAPTARDVDQTTVDNLISAVTAARATSFVDSAAKTGLDKPEIVVTLTSDGGRRVEKASFARSGADGFAVRDGEPGAAKVETATIDNVVKSFDGIK